MLNSVVVFRGSFMNVIMRILFVLLFLSSCTDKRTKDYERIMKPIVEIKTNDQEVRVYDGITEPALPDFEENDKTIMGIDANKDGVRDDIEIYINRTYEKANVRRALKQYVVGKYAVLRLAEDVDSSLALKTVERSSAILDCLSFVLPDYDFEMISKVNDLIFNTKDREEKFNYSYGKIGVGQLVGKSHEHNYEEWNRYCEFEIEDYENTRVNFLKIFDVYMGKKREEK
jgi:hypothetical protein